VTWRFRIARNPEPDSQLPYLVFMPLGSGRTFRWLGAVLADVVAAAETEEP